MSERTKKCFLCSIPESEEINRGRRNGTTIPQIQGWLEKERGYPRSSLKEERLRKHFRSSHHLNFKQEGKS